VKHNIIGIFSGKGGVGKTTVTVNLSAVLTQIKKNVIAIDTDIKMGGLGLHLGMFQFPTTLNDVILSNKNLYEALYIHSSGLRIIPAALSVQEIDTSGLKNILSAPFLSNNIVFIDSPPGLEKNAIDVLSACPTGIIVVTPEVTSIVNSLKVISEMEKTNTEILGAIVNMYNSNDKNQINLAEIESTLGIPILGVVPFDRDVKSSIFKKMPVVVYNPYSPASLEFKKIGAKLVGEEFKPESFVWIKRMIKRLKQ